MYMCISDDCANDHTSIAPANEIDAQSCVLDVTWGKRSEIVTSKQTVETFLRAAPKALQSDIYFDTFSWSIGGHW